MSREPEDLGHPGGTPRSSVTSGARDAETVSRPAESVSVCKDRLGDNVGIADALKVVKVPKRALYVLVARPEVTMAPRGAWIDELRA